MATARPAARRPYRPPAAAPPALTRSAALRGQAPLVHHMPGH